MAREWSEVRAAGRELREVDEDQVAELHAQMQASERAHRLAEVRKAQAMSQAEVAERMHISQPRVSAIESGEVTATELNTLKAYVEALGGEIRVVADFGDQSLRIA